MMAKVKVATTALTSCFGCHMSILDIDERLLDLLELVEFDKSPIDDKKEFTGMVDVGIIEGGVSNDENLEVVRDFRKHCKILISLGECAIQGNIPAYRNMVPLKECLEEAYFNGPTVVNPSGKVPDDPDIPILMNKVYPVHEVVKVDYFIPGCPPPADEIWAILSALLTGKPIELPYEYVKKD
jgi:NAD-reducing hydrogenase small subunit